MGLCAKSWCPSLAADNFLVKVSNDLATLIDVADPDLDVGKVVVGGVGAVAAVTGASLSATKVVLVVGRDNSMAVPAAVASECGGVNYGDAGGEDSNAADEGLDGYHGLKLVVLRWGSSG